MDKRWTLLLVVGLAVYWHVLGYTPQETNDVLRIALSRASFLMDIDTDEGLEARLGDNARMDSWRGFLGDDEDDGWSLEEKRQAFHWYLSSLGTRDFKHRRNDLDNEGFLDAAIVQCRLLNYTNAVDGLKALVVNSNGVCRAEAIKVVVAFSGVDDAMTSFVEGVVTNSANYAAYERCAAYGGYARKVGAAHDQPAVRLRAARLFYRYREMDYRITYCCDQVLDSVVAGYSQSSNRLAYAEWALQDPEGLTTEIHAYFTALTNRLHSLNQPLRQLNIGEDAE